MTLFRALSLPIAGLALLIAAAPAAAVNFQMKKIGAPDNDVDSEVMSCCHEEFTYPTTGYGQVADAFMIGRNEVTNSQWTEFLNAIAATDPNGIYNTNLGVQGEIVRAGVSGSFTYSVVAGRENMPARYLDIHRALRFANWMHNGQPTGIQDAASTEDGAYTLLGADPTPVARNPGARWWIPSEDEWYKAAYYDVGGDAWYDYPMTTDVEPMAAPPPGGPLDANVRDGPPGECIDAPCEATEVGSYTEAVGTNGTFDQCGNLFELTETFVNLDCEGCRGGWWVAIRGGWWLQINWDCASWARNFQPVVCNGCPGIGFRVAKKVPSGCGLGYELALVMPGLLALGWRRRRRRRLASAS